MANKILKGLALAAGTGVALGFSASLGRQRNTETPPLDDLKLGLKRQAKEIAALEQRFAKVSEDLPAAVEAAIAPRVDEVRTRLRAEMREAAAAGLAQIGQAIDVRLAGRMAALETTLGVQSSAIGALNQRALETDASMQKLISAVELLCDRAGARPAPELVAEPSFLDLPFQRQYEAALQREPATPPRMFVPAFQASDAREGITHEPKKC